MLTHLDLFSGLAGFAEGLGKIGVKTIRFIEKNEFCQDFIRDRYPDAKIDGDIEHAMFKRGEADIITAGWPCQDLSFAGRGAGITGERSGLFREYIRAIRLVRPKFTIMENVAALLVRGMGRVLGALAEVRHDAEWDCLPAADRGAPHERFRTWIVTYPTGVRQPESRRYINAVSPAPDAYREASGLVDAFQGGALPYVCERHHGIPTRLSRQINEALGNAIDPGFAEHIGRAIAK